MTDAERNEIFAKKKEETINRLLGENLNLPVPEEVAIKDIDKNWGTRRSWLDNHRPDKKSMNSQLTYEHKLSLMERDAKGYLVKAMEELPEETKDKEDKSKKMKLPSDG